MRNNAHKIGAVCYMLWGLLHITIGGALLYKLFSAGGAAALRVIGTALPPEQMPQTFEGLPSGILGQHAWNLVLFGFFSMIVGAALNWKNDQLGYWLNLGVVSAADVGFIFAIMLPGYIRFTDALMGPLLWILAVVFSTMGILSEK